jgi:hypothetical protein
MKKIMEKTSKETPLQSTISIGVIILFILFSVSLVSADDQLITGCAGDAELIIGCPVGDAETGIFFQHIKEVIGKMEVFPGEILEISNSYLLVLIIIILIMFVILLVLYPSLGCLDGLGSISHV